MRFLDEVIYFNSNFREGIVTVSLPIDMPAEVGRWVLSLRGQSGEHARQWDSTMLTAGRVYEGSQNV